MLTEVTRWTSDGSYQWAYRVQAPSGKWVVGLAPTEELARQMADAAAKRHS